MLTWKLEDNIISYWLNGVLIAREPTAARTTGVSVLVLRAIRRFAPQYYEFQIAKKIWNTRTEVL